jgi:3-deoxy-D-manno-octulosonic acid kinase
MMPPHPALPPGFERTTRGACALVADAALLPSAETLLDEATFGAAFRQPAGEGRAATALLELGPGLPRIWLRRLLHGGALGPLLGRAFWGMRRPLAELDVTARLHAAGAPVPRPALARGRRLLGPVFACAVGTYYEEDTRDVLAFLRAEPDAAQVLRAADALGRAVRRFHDAGGRHPDLHVKNLLLRERGADYEAIVIDLDRARIGVDVTPDERMSQLVRLFRSLLKRAVLTTVGTRGCARFLRAYCQDDRRLRRAMWRNVDRELRLVAIHKLRYPAEPG